MTPHSHTELSQVCPAPRPGLLTLGPRGHRGTVGLPDTPPNKMKTSSAALVCEAMHILLSEVTTKSLQIGQLAA